MFFFSKIFEVNGRLEIGLKLFRSLGFAPGFFSTGLIAVVLREEGT